MSSCVGFHRLMFIASLKSICYGRCTAEQRSAGPGVGRAIVSVQRREGRAMTSTPKPSTPESHRSSAPGILASLYAKLGMILAETNRYTLPLLRVSLGAVYVWFGALKLSDSTPVAQLVAKTVPFIPEHIFVPTLGAIEVLIGLGLII